MTTINSVMSQVRIITPEIILLLQTSSQDKCIQKEQDSIKLNDNQTTSLFLTILNIISKFEHIIDILQKCGTVTRHRKQSSKSNRKIRASSPDATETIECDDGAC